LHFEYKHATVCVIIKKTQRPGYNCSMCNSQRYGIYKYCDR